MIFNQEYEKWLKSVHGEVSEIQYIEMKQAFFAAGHVTLNIIAEASDIYSEDIAITKINNLHLEITSTMKQWM